jgi:hypothetical protein
LKINHGGEKLDAAANPIVGVVAVHGSDVVGVRFVQHEPLFLALEIQDGLMLAADLLKLNSVNGDWHRSTLQVSSLEICGRESSRNSHLVLLL